MKDAKLVPEISYRNNETGEQLKSSIDLTQIMRSLEKLGIMEMSFADKINLVNLFCADLKKFICLLMGISFNTYDEFAVTSVVPRSTTGCDTHFFGGYDVLKDMSASEQLAWRNKMLSELNNLPEEQKQSIYNLAWIHSLKGDYRRDFDTPLVKKLDDWQEIDTLALLHLIKSIDVNEDNVND